MFEVMWTEINSKYENVNKRKEFLTEKARDKFIEKLLNSDKLHQILATR